MPDRCAASATGAATGSGATCAGAGTRGFSVNDASSQQGYCGADADCAAEFAGMGVGNRTISEIKHGRKGERGMPD